jgi:ribosomal protein S12 methylthiotransferase
VYLFIGASDSGTLAQQLTERGLAFSDPIALHPGVRQYAGDLPHVRYLKVSEGCDHGCAFCAIPLMRGKHRSFSRDELVREAQLLELQGAREINLVAQDLAHYGRDRRDGVRLPQLLESLLTETSIPWIRMLYLYSAGITPQLLDVVARDNRVLPYLDMPIQHAADEVLARMRRPERKRTIREKVARFRDAVPNVSIRTTCIVGFPGETEEHFDELLEFLEEMQFDRVGAFTYSPQEGTRAADLADDVPESLKRERLERLTELQRLITADRYESRVGTIARAIVDRSSEVGTQARLVWQADDIDGVTMIDESHAPGSFVDVAIEEVVDDYDFRASVVRTVEYVDHQPAVRRALSLPVLETTISSYGR